jgi:hypothetical protein
VLSEAIFGLSLTVRNGVLFKIRQNSMGKCLSIGFDRWSGGKIGKKMMVLHLLAKELKLPIGDHGLFMTVSKVDKAVEI